MCNARAFFETKENIFVCKTHQATRGAVNFYSAGVVTRDRRIVSCGNCFSSVLASTSNTRQSDVFKCDFLRAGRFHILFVGE
jgi:hypothetical protein